VTGASLTQCLSIAEAAEALPVKKTGIETTPAQKPDYIPKGRQMERYKAFARQTEMPAITVTNNTTVEIGGAVKTDLTRLAQLSIPVKEALADQFRVPAGVIGKVADRTSTNSPPNTAQFIQDIRTAVVDYRFLQGEWQKYRPPTEGQKVKADALQALKVGDINKAWELYDGLQRPAPPDNLRIVGQP
jgi:hypothetical protein